VAALANRGTLPPPQIVAEVQDAGGVWAASPPLGHARAAVGDSAAEAVAALFPVRSGEAGVGGALVAGHASAALTGPRAEPLAWYLAFGPAANARIAVVVLVENALPERAEEIGNEVILEVLRP
jgi:cell division protein FtsI/penicillin-binding protein 2